jgi:adenylate cyclase class IV
MSLVHGNQCIPKLDTLYKTTNSNDQEHKKKEKHIFWSLGIKLNTNQKLSDFCELEYNNYN